MSGHYYGMEAIRLYWGVTPAETSVRVASVVAENAEYFSQFDRTADFMNAIKRAIVDRKMWNPAQRRWVPIEIAGSLN